MALSDKSVNISLNAINSVRRIEDDFIKRMATTNRLLERRLTSLLQEGSDVVDVALARSQVEQILIESGYFETTGNLVNQGYQQAIEQSYKQYQDLYSKSFQFSEVSLQRLNSLKQLDLNQFNGLSQTAIDRANRLFVDIQFGAINKQQAVELLQNKVVDTLQHHASTWISTGMSGIYREANVALAEDNGITDYEYVGPFDSLTRPFCKKHIGEVKTKDEWDSLDNGQIAPVSQFAGGFNCRHQLVGVI
jgi:hypothetical protein